MHPPNTANRARVVLRKSRSSKLERNTSIPSDCQSSRCFQSTQIAVPQPGSFCSGFSYFGTFWNDTPRQCNSYCNIPQLSPNSVIPWEWLGPACWLRHNCMESCRNCRSWRAFMADRRTCRELLSGNVPNPHSIYFHLIHSHSLSKFTSRRERRDMERWHVMT